jgi:hypothetical protein
VQLSNDACPVPYILSDPKFFMANSDSVWIHLAIVMFNQPRILRSHSVKLQNTPERDEPDISSSFRMIASDVLEPGIIGPNSIERQGLRLKTSRGPRLAPAPTSFAPGARILKSCSISGITLLIDLFSMEVSLCLDGFFCLLLSLFPRLSRRAARRMTLYLPALVIRRSASVFDLSHDAVTP